MFEQDFNLDLSDVQVETTKGYDIIPAGIYEVMTVSADLKETKNGKGKYINVCFKITDGEYKKSCLWHMFNVVNQNPKAVEIGKSQLKTLLTVGGRNAQSLSNLNNLLDIELKVKTKVEHNETYGDQSRITEFMPIRQGLKNHAPQAPKFEDNSEIPF